jgi:cytochrome c oxidase subunit 2
MAHNGPTGRTGAHNLMRTLVVFVTVAVAGMALLPETPVHAGVGKDPATAYAPAAVAASSAAAQSSDVKTVTVVAKRFTFEPATIQVTVGDKVRLVVTSADGVHGVGIRTFKVNTLVPRGGTPVTIDFTASEAGTFPIVCSEACGDGHADMRGSLVVVASSQ